MTRTAKAALAVLLPAAAALTGCASTASPDLRLPSAAVHGYAPAEKPVDPAALECLARAMYFESRRSDEDGLLAVGTVVMNRVESGRFPDTVCGVVGQKGQFAKGVMTRPMAKDREEVEAVAERVLKGERLAKVGKAKHFHAAGLRFGYRNMRYTCVAGGNSFYEKVDRVRRRPAQRGVSAA